MNYSNLCMFSEVKCVYVESYDNFNEVINAETKGFIVTQNNRDEFLIKSKDTNPLEEWEMRLSRNKKFDFIMNSCINYDHFVEVLEINIKKLSAYVTPTEIVAMGVQGNYLYPVGSYQEFSQLVLAWGDDYFHDESTQVEISDKGVDVSFQKESLKININCKLLASNEVQTKFPMIESKNIQDINLYINILVATHEPQKMQKSNTLSLSQSIKTHVYHATKLIEQRLEKIHTENKTTSEV